ncbi:hypothetical protein RC62_3690 [Flavobacterium aquidurense]|uniref:Uncharacterized protein n=1 Tax=Flavobacterium aquidurense TaxID=362413 RepID=A0A0Q0W8B1_9FLAO|nr:hypothetical protein RC62_3690 [Flavobacterium aquidurense]
MTSISCKTIIIRFLFFDTFRKYKGKQLFSYLDFQRKTIFYKLHQNDKIVSF